MKRDSERQATKIGTKLTLGGSVELDTTETAFISVLDYGFHLQRRKYVPDSIESLLIVEMCF